MRVAVVVLELLETTTRSVREVADEVGYVDVPSFRHRFTRHAGLSPSAYRNRYRIEAR